MSEQVLDSANVAGDSNVYRQVSDEATVGYRRAGIIDIEQADLILADPRTTFATTAFGELPAFTPIEHAIGAGYEIARSYQLAEASEDSQSVFYYALPPLKESDVTNISVPPVAEGYVYVDHAANDLATPLRVAGLLKNSAYQVVEVPLNDDQAAVGNEQASISLYGFHNPTADYTKQVTLREVANEYLGAQPEAAKLPEVDGAKLFKGDDLSADLVETLWSMYQDRFQWLGEKHPISMEDTKTEFVGLISSPQSVASIYFEAGQPTCFAYFTDELSSVYWLSKAFTEGADMGLHEGEKPLFWPGIVARPENVLNYAEPVIQLVTNMITSRQAPYMICFENTNRSEVYIPSLVKKYIDATGVIIDQPALIDRQVYRCFKFGQQPVES